MQANPGPLGKVILDEIALEGLEGITIEGLWKRLSPVLKLPLPLLDSFQEQCWKYIISRDKLLQFFLLPTKREDLNIYERFNYIDSDSGIPLVPNEYPYTLFKYCPVQDNEIRGSCELYKERELLPVSQLEGLSLTEIIEKYGNKLIIVAVQQLRENSLTKNTYRQIDLTLPQYCILEYIGRSRYNGELTTGKYSILNFYRDTAVIFYVRNKLLKAGIILRQKYTEKSNEKVLFAFLMTLTRFYRENKTLYVLLIEKSFHLLKGQPDGMMSLEKFKAELPENVRNSFRKMSKTQYFQKIFAIKKVKRKEVDETSEGKCREHTILAIALKNPLMKEEDLWLDEDSKYEEENKIEFCDERHYFVDMPYIEQGYRAVERFGSTGCTARQLMKYLAIAKLNIRALIKNLVKLGVITTYAEDFGRQRTTMYVAIKHSKKNKVIVNAEKTSDLLNNLKCKELTEICKVEESSRLKDIPDMIDSRRDSTRQFGKGISNVKSLRQIKRKNQIVELVNQRLIISTVDLKSLILKSEAEAGYKDQICRKSVVRCVGWLCGRNVVKYYEVTLKQNENARAIRYVVHPSIDLYHRLMNEEIVKQKHQFAISLEERKYRKITEQYKKDKLKSSELLLLRPILKNEVKSPKFLIARFFHELIFYLTYELPSDTKPVFVSQDIISQWNDLHPQVEAEKVLDEYNMSLYQTNLNWKMFISPLTKYESKPFGWVYLPDVLERMPLSVFAKMFELDRSAYPRLNELLMDPVRQHFPLKFLPPNLISQLNRIRMQRTYVQITKVLQNIGLIQVSPRLYKDPTHIWVYSNRLACITDTTGSEPGQYSISQDIEYPVMSFNFQSMHDLENYWNLLHKICLHTRLGMCGMQPKRVLKEISYLPSVDFDKAPELDNETVPGDGIGAGGLDSSLSSYLASNWSWRVAPMRNQQRTKKAATLRVKLAKLNQTSMKGVKKSRPKITVIAGKRFALKKKRPAPTKKKSKVVCDDIDKDALKRMQSLRVKWYPEEDNLLKKCRSIFLYLSPALQDLNLLQVAKIARDLLRSTLNSLNKTSMACLRRTQFLITRNRHLPEVPSWLYLLQKSPVINKKYGENFLTLLKQHYPEKADFDRVIKVHFLLLYGHLCRIIDESTDICNDQAAILPDTLPEYYAKFREFCPMPSDKETLLHHTPTSEEEIQIETINNLMHSSMCCTRDKTMYNIQLFEIYKQYSEDVLSKAFVKARDDQLVVLLKRRLASEKQSVVQLTGPAYTLSNKYRQVLHYMTIPYFVFDKVHEAFNLALTDLFQKNACVEYKSPNSGQFYVIAELIMSQSVLLDLAIPQNILTIDPEAQQSVSDPERILDHFRQIFDNAPQTEYVKQAENNPDGNQRKVKFKAGNESYKLIYNPYDVLTKLNDTYMHFFCTLDSLYRGASLDFTKLKDDALCPFNCVLKNSNHIEVIEKIINEKKCIFKDLTPGVEDELPSTAVVVKPENVLNIFNKLKTFLTLRNAKADKKDWGKMQIKPAHIDVLELCQQLMDYKDVDQNTQSEFEPTLNKEERLARAQDVFSINLPLLKFKSPANVSKPPEELQIHIKEREILDRFTKLFLIEEKQISDSVLSKALKEEGFDAAEEKLIYTLLAFLESNSIGATAEMLLQKYQDEHLLLKATQYLRRQSMIIRVGVEDFTYVHKAHIQSWVISSYHIKRLERESMGETTSTCKRKLSINDDSDDVVEVKRSKNDEVVESGKRVPKPVERFKPEQGASTSKAAANSRPKELLTIRPAPWIRVNGSLNRRVLDRWAGSILTETMIRSGWTAVAAAYKFNQLHPVDIYTLLELLQDIGCVKLNAFTTPKASLFSEYEQPVEYEATEFTPKDKIFITATPNAMTRMTMFIGEKKYNAEFI